MLTVGICDSSQEYRAYIKKIIWNFFYTKTDIEIKEYKDGNECISSISIEQSYLDLLILEINLPDMNGLAIADMLKRGSVNTDIIVLTETNSFVFEGYKYGLFDYILKTPDMNSFKLSLERYAHEHMDSTVEYLCLRTKGCVQHIRLDKINYFESRGRKIAAISDDEEFEFYFKMDDLISSVPQNRFVRCHQSYIVNIGSIQSFSHTRILTKNGFDIPVSRKYFPNLKQMMDKMLIIT